MSRYDFTVVGVLQKMFFNALAATDLAMMLAAVRGLILVEDSQSHNTADR